MPKRLLAKFQEVLFAFFQLLLHTLSPFFVWTFCSLVKMKPKLPASGEKAVNHQTAMFTGVLSRLPFVHWHCFPVFKSITIKQPAISQKTRKQSAFEEQIMILFIEDHFHSSDGSLLPEVHSLFSEGVVGNWLRQRGSTLWSQAANQPCLLCNDIATPTL